MQKQKGKTQACSPEGEREAASKGLGQRSGSSGSDSEFQLGTEPRTAEMRRPEIPFSVNRYQGRYQEVVPQKFKERSGLWEQERIQKELKKEEARQRSQRAKAESERIRKGNQRVLSPKKKEAPIPQSTERPPETAATHRQKDSEESRIREMGLELIQHFVHRKRERRSQTQTLNKSEAVFRNEQIRVLMLCDGKSAAGTKSMGTTAAAAAGFHPAEERRRRKVLVEEQKRGFMVHEADEKAKRLAQINQLRKRLDEVKNLQKKLREAPAKPSTKRKRKSKRHHKKIAGEKSHQKGGMRKLPSPQPESDTEPAGKSTIGAIHKYRKQQRETIARKASQIRESQAQYAITNIRETQKATMPLSARERSPVAFVPRGLSTSAHDGPTPLHVWDVTVSARLPEDEKQRFKERMREFRARVTRLDEQRKPDEEAKAERLEEEGKAGSVAPPPPCKEEGHGREAAEDLPSEQKQPDSFSREDYGRQILRSMEELEQSPQPKPAPMEEEKNAPVQAASITDYDSSEDSGADEPQAILCTPHADRDLEEPQIRASREGEEEEGEETKRANEQLRRKLAEKDSQILAQAARETKLQKEYQELVTAQTRELTQQVSQIVHDMRSSSRDEQLTGAVGKLCAHMDSLAQRAGLPSENPKPEEPTVQEEFAQTDILPAPVPEPKEENSEPPQEISVTSQTYERVRGLVDANPESRSLIEEEDRLQRTHAERLQSIMESHTSPRSHDQALDALDEWYNEQRGTLVARQKQALATILQQAAAELMAEAKENIGAADAQPETKEELKAPENTPHDPQDAMAMVTERERRDPDRIKEIDMTGMIESALPQDKVSLLPGQKEEVSPAGSISPIEVVDPELPFCQVESQESHSPNSAVKQQEEDPKVTRANLIADQIYEKLVKSLAESPMFLRRPEVPKVPSGIKTALWNVEGYVDEIFKAITDDPERFVAALSVPLNRDPIFILGQIQNEENDYFETIEQIMTQPVLPVDLYLGLEHSRKIDSIAEKPDDAQHEALLTEWSNIHNKCIFDAINDSLDYYRPYGLKGPPLPWSKQTRELTYRNGSIASTEDVLLGVKTKVLSWAMSNSGALQLPDELDLAALLGQLGMTKSAEGKSKLDQYREERLLAVLFSEVNDMEPTWVDYELEETQVVLDVTDMILEQMTGECLGFLIGQGGGK